MSSPQHRGRLSGFEEHRTLKFGRVVCRETERPPPRSSRGSVGSQSRRWESHSSNHCITTRFTRTAHIPSTAEKAQIDRRAA